MKKTAEAVSLGHPDKSSDFISSYILDKLIIQDSHIKYAVEVLFKNNTVVLGGEICGDVDIHDINTWVKEAICGIGYNSDYYKLWGDFTVNPDDLHIINLVGQQSVDINRGVEQNGWGDQGVFVGYACQGPDNIGSLALRILVARVDALV